jgi:AcrR family transcriptional regulator
LSAPPRRPRGRPAGGGNNAEQARQVLLDAAEQLFIRGEPFTMEIVAREAGYSRSATYTLFSTRRELVAALIQRTTQRTVTSLLQTLPYDAGLIEIIIESMVIVATQLIDDPLMKTIAAQTQEGTIASLIAEDDSLTMLAESGIAAIITSEQAATLRPGLNAHDVAQFIIATALSMLLHVIPGSDDPATARRYIETFVLPAILVNPPPAVHVFERQQRQ